MGEVVTEPDSRIATDMKAFADVPHGFAGTEGERTMLKVVRGRLPEEVSSKIEGFVAHTSPAFILGLHLALLVVMGIIGFWHPRVTGLLSALVTLSLVGEGTGRFALIRSLFPKKASYNLVVREASSPSLGAVVLSAPLDLPTWRPLRRRWLRFRPLQAVFAAVLVVDVMLALRSLAEPWGPATLKAYVLALVALGVTVTGGAVYHRVGEPHGDGGAPAALLELIRRLRAHPVPGVDLWFTFTGCSYAFQGGMQAFLALHKGTLPDPCLVVVLDHPAQAPVRAAVSEGPLFAQHHRSTGPALVERLRWAGVFVPPIDLGNVTDARAALVRGYRALALVGGDEKPSPEAVLRAVDVAETLVRWYGEDLARVADVRPSLEELARATSASRRKPRRARGQAPDEPDTEAPAARDAVGEGS